MGQTALYVLTVREGDHDRFIDGLGVSRAEFPDAVQLRSWRAARALARACLDRYPQVEIHCGYGSADEEVVCVSR